MFKSKVQIATQERHLDSSNQSLNDTLSEFENYLDLEQTQDIALKEI